MDILRQNDTLIDPNDGYDKGFVPLFTVLQINSEVDNCIEPLQIINSSVINKLDNQIFDKSFPDEKKAIIVEYHRVIHIPSHTYIHIPTNMDATDKPVGLLLYPNRHFRGYPRFEKLANNDPKSKILLFTCYPLTHLSRLHVLVYNNIFILYILIRFSTPFTKNYLIF